MADSVIERLRRWRAKSHEEKVEQTIDRLMITDILLYWYLLELEDLREQLSKDVVLRRLVPIVEKMMQQLWDLMRRWRERKHEIIKAVREGLMRRERVIEGNGFWIHALYYKGVIDLRIILSGGGGDYARIPNLGIPKEVLRAMRLGWRASDASDNNDRYPRMGTFFAWQAISWLISIPPGKEAWIYTQGISVSMDGIKPVWHLQINGFEVEWPDDVTAYREMAKLPRDLLPIAVLHAVLGDGHSRANNGTRGINLANDDRDVLEELRARLEEEFRVKGSIGPVKGGWYYDVHGENAKTLAEVAIESLQELALTAKRLYDQMADGSRYTLIWFEKWARIVRASRYIRDKSKIEFASMAWTPSFTNGSIFLKIKTKDAEYAERIRREVEAQDIGAVIMKYVDNYEVRIEWSALKRYLCNERLREQLIKSAMRAIENCKLKNMTHLNAKKDCDEIPAAQWLRKLQDIEWLRSIGCSEA